MIRAASAILCCGLALLSAAAQAQPVPQTTSPAEARPPIDPSAACELHVWPAAEIKAVTQGMILNHTVTGIMLNQAEQQASDAVKGGIPKPRSLAPEAQIALLSGVDLPALLRLPDARIVTHAEPLARTSISVKQRHAASASPCYAELIVSQLFYEYAPMAGRALKSMFVYRQFGDAAEPRSVFSTWGETSLLLFPPATPDKAEQAEAELANAYKSNARIFAGYAVAPRGKGRAR